MEKNISKLLFLSWEGDESKCIAKQLKNLMEGIFYPTLKSYMSAVDAPLGKRGVEDLSRQLSECNYGVCLVNKENVRAPWIHYEAGAIAKESPISRLIVLLLDNDPGCIKGTPLQDFKYCFLTYDGILEIVETMIDICGLSREKKIFIDRLNDKWSEFETNCETIISEIQIKGNNPEKTEIEDHLDPIMHMLVDIRNYLKEDISNSVKNMSTVSRELKELMSTLSSKEWSMMQIQYSNGRYEKLLNETAKKLDEVIALLDNLVKENPENHVEQIKIVIDNLKNFYEELCSQIYD